MSTLGFITIGQSPRPDVVRSMLPDSDGSTILEAGALDSLDHDIILGLRPGDGESTLVTRLRDGSEVIVSKQRLIPHLQSAISDIVARGATRVVVLCTGEFPQLDAAAPVIYPDRLLTATVDAVFPAGMLGVVMPHADQRQTMEKKWQTPERNVVSLDVSPYSSASELEEAGLELANAGAGMIMLDCMGFDESMRSRVSAAIDVPVLLANRLVGRMLEELMASSAASDAPSRA